jgi:hypothetical protein
MAEYISQAHVYTIKVLFNIILTSTLRLHKWPLSFILLSRIVCGIIFSPACTVSFCGNSSITRT